MKLKQLSFRVSVLAGLMFSASLNAQDLLDLYQIALTSDPQFQAARATLSSVRETENIATSLLLPNVGLSASADRVHNDVKSSPTATDDTYNKHDVSVSLTQPIYRRDRWLAVEQAKNLNVKADADFAAAEQSLILRLSQAYFNVLSAKDSLSFVRADKKAIARQLDQAKQRFEVGLIAITAVHEAQAAYDQSVANEIDAENTLDNSYEALREIVGEQNFNLESLGAALKLVPPDPADLSTWTEQALQQNPGIIAAQNTAEVARQEIEVQRSGHYPTLDLVGAHAINRSQARSASELDSTSVGLQLALPLYAGGGVTASTRQAQYDFEAAQQGVEQQQRAVTRQVRDAYRGVIASISRVNALEATRISAKSALDATEAGFEVGTRTIVDVLDSQRNLYSTMNDYAQARYNYILNGLSLQQAAGSLSEEDLRAVNAWLEGN
ncbi:MAG: TolC family outer membrane protein [Chromatiales bacterium]|jgi:outer membrane protein